MERQTKPKSKITLLEIFRLETSGFVFPWRIPATPN